jgi:hypothetical protein
MNGFQKGEKIKAAPSDDLDLPEGPEIQDTLSFHDCHSSLGDESALHGLAHQTLGSSHCSLDQWIRSGLSTFIELSSENDSKGN